VTSYLVGLYRLIVASSSLRTTNRPLKGRGYITWPALNFHGLIRISVMAEATAVKFCIGRLYQRDNKSSLKGAWIGSRDPLFACATVDSEKFRHATPCNWDQQCRRRRTSVSLTYMYGARCQYTDAQAPSVRFLVYLLQTCLFYSSTTNRPSGVWALPCMYVLITNRWRSV